MKYVVINMSYSNGYCYNCNKCGSVCNGLYECAECPNVARAK